MAVHAPITGAPFRAPFVPAPPAAITRVLSRFDRVALEGFIAVALDLLDFADGDPDREDGDEDMCAARDDTGSVHPNDGYGDGHAGDPDDAEDDGEDMCLAGDDGCGPYPRGGTVYWGSEWDA